MDNRSTISGGIAPCSLTFFKSATYSAFGRAEITLAKISNNLRLPGQYFDKETGLHYNFQCYYDPDTGRYITVDPIGLRGGINLYAYVGGNPITRSDWLGLKWQKSNCIGLGTSASFKEYKLVGGHYL